MTNLSLSHIEDFATQAHKGQSRKYTNDPYIIHPIAVAKLVHDIGGSMVMRAAALLHDVLEDTHVGHEELMVFLHSVPDVTPAEACEIHSLVVELTDIYTHESFPNRNRKARKLLEAERLGRASGDAQTIKYCDLIDNTSSITTHDPGFAKTYMAEKAVLLKHMQCGDQGAHMECWDNVHKFEKA